MKFVDVDIDSGLVHPRSQKGGQKEYSSSDKKTCNKHHRRERQDCGAFEPQIGFNAMDSKMPPMCDEARARGRPHTSTRVARPGDSTNGA